ncbi:MAG TPA: phosphoglucomutase (alpha-D-glucose-1,6-bisphosphate-dependent) [Vicinamibacterales bacterium]
MPTSPLAGQPAPASTLVDLSRLVAAYYDERPDPGLLEQRVAFGTSGHRGSSLNRSFNEWHILAIAQAISDHRSATRTDGPLFLGIDTHALSRPASQSAIEVLAANGVTLMLAEATEYTPTPAVSHAILTYNRGRRDGLADGIVVTPSHNPPEDGGFKYNPPHGGPAGASVTNVIEARANDLLGQHLRGVRRMPLEQALQSPVVRRHDFLGGYVGDLPSVIDLDLVRASGLELGVDPLGGAGVDYWPAIADRYHLDLKVVNEVVDPRFAFMTMDWDGRIRMDPSSPYAMQRLIGLKDRFDVAFACDTDHDRHGIVTKTAGLLPPNHYLSACVQYLFANRPEWRSDMAVGKSVVSSSMIDRVAARLDRRLHEVPVGFKWFVDGLLSGSLGFAGEESAGSSFLRRDGTVWTTDKDGIIAALLAAEMTARTGRDPGEVYATLTAEFGSSSYERLDAPATAGEKRTLQSLSSRDIGATRLAGQPVQVILTRAPGDGEPLGGVKVVAEGGWFAARPSGTEEIYKLYAESFVGPDHLARIQHEAQAIISAAFGRQPR